MLQFLFVRLSPYNRNFKGVFMDIYTILSTIFRYSLLALGGIAVLVPLYAAGFLIYKKVFHGTKKLQIGQWISLILLSGWLLLVLGLTTFSRGANFGGSVNLSLFSGYINETDYSWETNIYAMK